MKALQPPDTHHLSAAEGWLELGNYLEANSELDNITAANRALPAVLRVRYGVFAAARNWPLAYEVACALTVLTANDPQAWVDSSYVLHEMRRTREARDKLAAVVAMFPDHPVMRYNLACYE